MPTFLAQDEEHNQAHGFGRDAENPEIPGRMSKFPEM
jgi:hypothetical protein